MTNTQAFLKLGLMGFAGSGKTHTASMIAIGLHRKLVEAGVHKADLPVFFLDTETGVDWVRPMFEDAGIELEVAKTRAFADLLTAVNEVGAQRGILLIDSISHFWRELTETYAKKKNRKFGLQFQDWAELKKMWGEFTDRFINSPVHIIMCGRAGYEYDFFENEDGKKELEKTGIKMKAETELGYEPSLLVLMERFHDMQEDKVYRVASVLKDRARVLDGKRFKNPTFESFAPHIAFLNLGGNQLGVDTERNSDEMIKTNDDQRIRSRQKEIVLDEIQSLIVKHYPGQSAKDKAAKVGLLEDLFHTTSWERVKSLQLEDLQAGFANLQMRLEGASEVITHPLAFEDDDLPTNGNGVEMD